jgi:hypothetical protein
MNQNTPVTPAQPANRGNNVSSATSTGSSFSNLHKQPGNKLFKIGSVALLFFATALVVASIIMLGFGGNNSQQQAVLKDKYQAVFLNNGQVYFGKVNSINPKTVDLRGIYYLQTNGSTDTTTQASTASTNVSLVKLGCELHAPYDQMLINNDQVIFWENLQDSSQVVQAITKYQKDNTGKQACSTASQNSTQQAPSTTAPATTAPTTTAPAPATTPTIKKP